MVENNVKVNFFFQSVPVHVSLKLLYADKNNPSNKNILDGTKPEQWLNSKKQNTTNRQMDKVPRITQEMTYQANLDILYQPKHKENGWSWTKPQQAELAERTGT